MNKRPATVELTFKDGGLQRMMARIGISKSQRARILDEAEALLVEKGYKKATVRNISRTQLTTIAPR